MSTSASFYFQRSVSQGVDFLLFSNLFIALCAVAQGAITYHLLGATCDKHVLGVLFFATLALYNFSMLLSKPAAAKQSPFNRVRWIARNYRLMITLTMVAILSLMVATLFLSTAAQLLLVLLGFIAISYNLPLFSIGDHRFGLRNVPGLKLFLIASVWALSTVLLPIVELSNSQAILISASDTLVLTAKSFFFIAAITVPFDIRDLYQDRSYNLRTIPVIFGEKKSYLLAQLLLASSLLLLLLFLKELNPMLAAFFASGCITSWLIIRSSSKKNERFYFLWLDGTMLFQLILLQLITLVFSAAA